MRGSLLQRTGTSGKEVEAGRFRNDLWYRLSVFPISIPPLRERKEDIPSLVAFFVASIAGPWAKSIEAVPAATIRKLQEYHWPGNVRELENIVERAVISSSAHHLNFEIPIEGAPRQRYRGIQPRTARTGSDTSCPQRHGLDHRGTQGSGTPSRAQPGHTPVPHAQARH